MTSGVAAMDVSVEAPTLPDPPARRDWTPVTVEIANLFLVGEYRYWAGFAATRHAQRLRDESGLEASTRKGWVHVVLEGTAA